MGVAHLAELGNILLAKKYFRYFHSIRISTRVYHVSRFRLKFTRAHVVLRIGSGGQSVSPERRRDSFNGRLG